MAVSIDEMRAYARLDADTDNSELSVLKSCMEAAVAWFEGAGVGEDTDSPLYDLGVKMLALSWFENRGADTAVSLHSVPQGVYAIKHQLCALPDCGIDAAPGAGGDALWPM